jgi:hypothetical protein
VYFLRNFELFKNAFRIFKKNPNLNRPNKGPATNYPNAQCLASSQAAAAPVLLPSSHFSLLPPLFLSHAAQPPEPTEREKPDRCPARAQDPSWPSAPPEPAPRSRAAATPHPKPDARRNGRDRTKPAAMTPARCKPKSARPLITRRLLVVNGA